jgi:hypothetical protein
VQKESVKILQKVFKWKSATTLMAGKGNYKIRVVTFLDPKIVEWIDRKIGTLGTCRGEVVRAIVLNAYLKEAEGGR